MATEKGSPPGNASASVGSELKPTPLPCRRKHGPANQTPSEPFHPNMKNQHLTKQTQSDLEIFLIDLLQDGFLTTLRPAKFLPGSVLNKIPPLAIGSSRNIWALEGLEFITCHGTITIPWPLDTSVFESGQNFVYHEMSPTPGETSNVGAPRRQG
jgi:hypothetical protein